MLIGAMVAGVIRIMKIQKFLFQAYFSRFKIQFSDIWGSQNKAPNKLGYNFTWIWVTIFVFYVWSFYLIKLAIGTAKKPVFIKKKWKLQKMLYFTLSQPPFKGYNPGWLSSWDNYIGFNSRYRQVTQMKKCYELKLMLKRNFQTLFIKKEGWNFFAELQFV